jgi:membrane fusion protein (multidrug efflux system)
LQARVLRVAQEQHDGLVRVELTVQDPSSFAAPLQHGLPGVTEIEIDRVSPASLLLRALGRWLSPEPTGTGS